MSTPPCTLISFGGAALIKDFILEVHDHKDCTWLVEGSGKDARCFLWGEDAGPALALFLHDRGFPECDPTQHTPAVARVSPFAAGDYVDETPPSLSLQ